MHKLDSPVLIKRLDSQGMVGSIESLALQCQQAWDEVNKIKIPRSYRDVDNIILNGMGGSALGADVVLSLFGNQMKKPFFITHGYTLPGFVNSKTLCILSSYSGTTEEVVRSFTEARKRKAKIIIICAGGTLATLAKKHRIPAYVFDPRFNPSGQPRMAVGYSLIGVATLLKRSGHLRLSPAEFNAALRDLIRMHKVYGTKAPAAKNPSKQAALAVHNRVTAIVAAEHLSGNAHIFANQTNENGKNFAGYFLISEMNHHLMEGLVFPKHNPKNLAFVFIESGRYNNRNKKRFTITKRVLKKHNIPYYSVTLKSKSALAQAFEALLFGSYASFYLSLLNGIDPSPIPVVDYFKTQLKK